MNIEEIISLFLTRGRMMTQRKILKSGNFISRISAKEYELTLVKITQLIVSYQ